VAPLHLLPEVIPVCLSLHNAEFQGLWPLRTPAEVEEICRVYNLEKEVVEQYVQYGEVFNLLHAGASYLRIHQGGFGAVGVSAKYGKRVFARFLTTNFHSHPNSFSPQRIDLRRAKPADYQRPGIRSSGA
jgi:alpha-1,3-glucan synthase